MKKWLYGLAATAAVAIVASVEAAPPRDHHLSGGGTASISQVAMNVSITNSGSASGNFVCLMAGRSGFVLPGFGLAHNMIVHATPSAGSVTGTVATFSGSGRLTLDGKKKMDVQITVWANVANQTFRLTVVGLPPLPIETMRSGHLTLR